MIAASVYMIVFRIFHILAGVLWVGGLALLVLYLQPSARSLGPTAGPFMQELLARRRLPLFLLSMGATTIVAGLFLYWRDWQLAGTLGDWLGTAYGAVLTLGSASAIAAWLIGFFGIKPTLDRMLGLAARLATGGTPPSSEQAAEVQALQQRARQLAILVLSLLVLSVLTMATARYW